MASVEDVSEESVNEWVERFTAYCTAEDEKPHPTIARTGINVFSRGGIPYVQFGAQRTDGTDVAFTIYLGYLNHAATEATNQLLDQLSACPPVEGLEDLMDFEAEPDDPF